MVFLAEMSFLEDKKNRQFHVLFLQKSHFFLKSYEYYDGGLP